jgi:hypothetical protein
MEFRSTVLTDVHVSASPAWRLQEIIFKSDIIVSRATAFRRTTIGSNLYSPTLSTAPPPPRRGRATTLMIAAVAAGRPTHSHRPGLPNAI